jgi:hypothetical protein
MIVRGMAIGRTMYATGNEVDEAESLFTSILEVEHLQVIFPCAGLEGQPRANLTQGKEGKKRGGLKGNAHDLLRG